MKKELLAAGFSALALSGGAEAACITGSETSEPGQLSHLPPYYGNEDYYYLADHGNRLDIFQVALKNKKFHIVKHLIDKPLADHTYKFDEPKATVSINIHTQSGNETITSTVCTKPNLIA